MKKLRKLNISWLLFTSYDIIEVDYAYIIFRYAGPQK